ncbi:MAG: TonB-dependent receptor [Flaviaesturariibacter sp.]|nr:TonB-dependent receptor [Flaviaesturariibacter sp.]
MRPLYILFLLSLLTITSFAQRITGTLKDVKGLPIEGASITIKDSYDGGTSDSAGKFSFSTMEKGEKVIIATGIGYKAFEQAVKLDKEAIALSIVLKEEITELKAVVITAGSFEASDKKKTTVLNSIDIVTTASANADVTGAVKTLPGAQQVGESEGLFVRGGTAAETKTFIDGTLVNNFFYSSVPGIAQRGRFSPFLFKGTVFSAGGYSALYGQALSSALILESIDLPDQASASVGVSVIGGNAGYQNLSKDKRSSWGVGYGYTNLAPAFAVIKQKQEFSRIPDYHAGDANFRIKTSKTGMLKYYGYFSQNALGIRTNSIDTLGYKDAFRLKNFNMYHNVAWRENLGKGWKLNLGASYANNLDDINGALLNGTNEEVSLSGFETKNFGLETKGTYVNAKAVVEYRLQGLSAIRFGSEYNYSNDRSDYTLFTGNKYPGKVTEHLKSLFAEGDVYLTNNIAAKVGGRMEHSALLDKVNLAPRLSLAYKLGTNSQASVAYGIFYQNPERRFLPAVANLDFAKATHYIAQYQKTTALQTLRAEVFYKKYQSLIKTGVANGQESAISNNGYGDAKGFELFWRDKQTVKNFDYWISYSFLDTKRDFQNFPTAIEPSFAAKHTASLVMKKFVTKMKTQFNASYTYASGRPYYNIRYNNTANKFAIYDRGRTIDYNSMSLSVNYLPNVFKKGAGKFSVLVFSVTNVLGQNQVFGYNYSYSGHRKEAIVPPSKMFVFLGAFITFGVDRTDDIINSNL